MDTTVMRGPLDLTDGLLHIIRSLYCISKLLQKHPIATATILWNLKLLLYCICYTLWIDWFISFWLEQKGGSLITPMAPAHPLHPDNSRSRNKRRNVWFGWCVSSWLPLFPSRNTVLIYIYIYVCILYTSAGYMTYIYIHTQGVSFCIGEAAPLHSL